MLAKWISILKNCLRIPAAKRIKGVGKWSKQMVEFIQYVEEWNQLCADIAKLEAKLKPLKAKEMAMRKAIVDSVGNAQPLMEGMNSYQLDATRKLAIGYKLDRKIEEPAIALAREEYNKLNNRPVAFDQLLRVKYELNKRDYDKLSEPGKLAVSRMITTKPAAPTVEIR